jgi:hypothetical protein
LGFSNRGMFHVEQKVFHKIAPKKVFDLQGFRGFHKFSTVYGASPQLLAIASEYALPVRLLLPR